MIEALANAAALHINMVIKGTASMPSNAGMQKTLQCMELFWHTFKQLDAAMVNSLTLDSTLEYT
jgi:hypothetical protein